MSTEIGDFKNSVLSAVAVYPIAVADTNVSPSIDMIDGDGRCFAMQMIGSVAGVSASLAGKIQESADGFVWTDVPNGAFSAVTVASNSQTLVFERTKRYLRHSRTVTGTSPLIQLCVFFGQQRKTI